MSFTLQASIQGPVPRDGVHAVPSGFGSLKLRNGAHVNLWVERLESRASAGTCIFGIVLKGEGFGKPIGAQARIFEG